MFLSRFIKYLHNKYLEKKSKSRVIKHGDVIGTSRIIYDHYGVYTKDGQVIHYTMAEEGWKLEIRKTGIDAFLHGSTTFFILDFDYEKPLKSAPVKYRDVLRKMKVFSPEETVKRAESRIGEKEYNLISNNCEHFAIWCKTGISESHQVETFLKFVPKIKKRGVLELQTTI